MAAASHGADALGFIFWRPSKRFVEPAEVPRLTAQLPPMLTKVAVVVDPEPAELSEILALSGADCVQFHGDEPAELCESCNRPYIKSVRVRARSDVEDTLAAHPRASALLLDTYKAGLPGGTGESFDWSLVPLDSGKPLILAGGLNRGNVAQAIAAVTPYAVDVSGGVESEPGVKDPAAIRAFLNEVNRARATQ